LFSSPFNTTSFLTVLYLLIIFLLISIKVFDASFIISLFLCYEIKTSNSLSASGSFALSTKTVGGHSLSLKVLIDSLFSSCSLALFSFSLCFFAFNSFTSSYIIKSTLPNDLEELLERATLALSWPMPPFYLSKFSLICLEGTLDLVDLLGDLTEDLPNGEDGDRSPCSLLHICLRTLTGFFTPVELSMGQLPKSIQLSS